MRELVSDNVERVNKLVKYNIIAVTEDYLLVIPKRIIKVFFVVDGSVEVYISVIDGIAVEDLIKKIEGNT